MLDYMSRPAWCSGSRHSTIELKGWGSNPGRSFFFLGNFLSSILVGSTRSLPVQEASQVGNRYRRSSNVVSSFLQTLNVTTSSSVTSSAVGLFDKLVLVSLEIIVRNCWRIAGLSIQPGAI